VLENARDGQYDAILLNCKWIPRLMRLLVEFSQKLFALVKTTREKPFH